MLMGSPLMGDGTTFIFSFYLEDVILIKKCFSIERLNARLYVCMYKKETIYSQLIILPVPFNSF